MNVEIKVKQDDPAAHVAFINTPTNGFVSNFNTITR